MLPHHEHEIIRRIEKLFNVGEAIIEDWEKRLWYSQGDTDKKMYVDIQNRYDVLFAEFYGNSDDSYLTVIKNSERTIFLNSELLIRLDALISR